MAENLEELLLKRHFGSQTLFKKAVDIARKVIHIEETRGANKNDPGRKNFLDLSNLKVYLSRALKSNRSLPFEFVTVLKLAVSERLNNFPDIDKKAFMDELAETIQKSSPKLPTSRAIHSEFNELNEAFKTQTKMVQFADRAMETFDDEKSRVLIDAILKNVRIVDTSTPIDTDMPQYEYYFPTEAKAVYFYTLLLRRANAHSNTISTDMGARFETLNKKGYLRVFITDNLSCTFRTVVFNHESLTPSGYVIFTQGANNFSVGKMTAAELQGWYTNIYSPAQFKAIEFKFPKSIS